MTMHKHERFGNWQIPFAEPAWYAGTPSPYYTDSHAKLRAAVRKFVEEELKPNLEKWIKEGYPKELHERVYEAGFGGLIYPKEYGGTAPDDFDIFHELIMLDEMARLGGGGVLGQAPINSMALPPVLMAGTEEQKDTICRAVITGKKAMCLAISEPWAGSDVAGIRTEAKREGEFYIVNGAKKWITGGMFADYFLTAVRTGDAGMGGISLLLIDRITPGISVRKMETQFDNAHNTTFVTFKDVKVPVGSLIGPENAGFMLIMANFNHERLVIAAASTRYARVCYEEAFTYALKRKTFGKRLVDHQIIRHKLAEMARQIEALQDNLDKVAYLFKANVGAAELGGRCALLKVNASKCFEFCAREAVQIFGGSGIVKEGQGKTVERLYREVRGQAIPGGSEEILLDFAMRQAIAKAQKNLSKSKL